MKPRVDGRARDELVVHDLTLRIDEAQETLTAIRSGEVDALVVAAGGQRQVFILKGADQAHRILLETLNEGALTIAADATILYANRRFSEMIGRPLERTLGASLHALVAPADTCVFHAILSGAASGRSKGEITLLTTGGDPITVMVSMSAVRQEGDATYTVVLTDLSPLKQAENALRRANEELEARVADRTAALSKANQALQAEIAERTRLEGELRRQSDTLVEANQHKDEFLLLLAHELRNPLAPILSATEMMRLTTSDKPPLDRYRGMIERQVRNLTRFVDDVFDVSRIARGAITLHRQVIDLSSAVRNAMEAARPLLEGGSHALRVALPAEPVRIFVDPARFDQILVNVLDNAAKYTARGGFIQVSAERRGGEVLVRVKDNGPGIPAGLLPRVFDLFVQGERAPERAQGLGVGLTLVKSLVEMHDGRVEAHSAGPGQGSEIAIYLPVAPPPTTLTPPGDPNDKGAAAPAPTPDAPPEAPERAG